MIEKKILEQNIKEFELDNVIDRFLKNVPIKKVSLEKTSDGEKIIIQSLSPGLIIGKEGSRVKELTQILKDRFNFQNPHIKIKEVEDPFSSSRVVGKMISNDLVRFGASRFKFLALKYINRIMDNGAMGCEVRISGKVPSSRAKSWRFSKGYLKKTGYISDFVIDKTVETANLPSGTIGIKIMIMKKGTPLPDRITYVWEEREKEMRRLEEEKIREEKEEMEKNENKEDEK